MINTTKLKLNHYNMFSFLGESVHKKEDRSLKQENTKSQSMIFLVFIFIPPIFLVNTFFRAIVCSGLL